MKALNARVINIYAAGNGANIGCRCVAHLYFQFVEEREETQVNVWLENFFSNNL
jgi:hypothetical protein